MCRGSSRADTRGGGWRGKVGGSQQLQLALDNFPRFGTEAALFLVRFEGFLHLRFAFGDFGTITFVLEPAIAELDQHVHHARVIREVVMDLLLEDLWIEPREQLEEMSGRHLNAGLLDR